MFCCFGGAATARNATANAQWFSKRPQQLSESESESEWQCSWHNPRDGVEVSARQSEGQERVVAEVL